MAVANENSKGFSYPENGNPILEVVPGFIHMNRSTSGWVNIAIRSEEYDKWRWTSLHDERFEGGDSLQSTETLRALRDAIDIFLQELDLQ